MKMSRFQRFVALSLLTISLAVVPVTGLSLGGVHNGPVSTAVACEACEEYGQALDEEVENGAMTIEEAMRDLDDMIALLHG